MTAPVDRQIWGTLQGHTRRHAFTVFALECSEGDDYDDPFVERPHSRWPNGKEPHLVRMSEVSASRRLPRCKRCLARISVLVRMKEDK